MKPQAWMKCFLVLVLAAPFWGRAEETYWVETAKQTHAKFKGTPGTFAHFGDSITVTMAFWTPLQWDRKNMNTDTEAAFKLVKEYMKPDCWQKWKGPEYGNEGGMTIRWARQNVEKWLEKLNPEVALIMFGTNDLGQLKADEYEQKTREVVQKCLDNGTIVILSTIPPRTGQPEKSQSFAEIVKKVATGLKVPLCDYFGECLKRRPDDWDGTMAKFKDRKGYDVMTLISGDGVHPSNPKEHAGDYSEEGLKTNGYTLRSYLVLVSYAEVIRKALRTD